MSEAAVFKALPVEESRAVADWFAQLSKSDAESAKTAWDVIAPLFSRAPYLLDIAARDTSFLVRILSESPAGLLKIVLSDAAFAGREAPDADAIAKALRIAKKRIALMAAIYETGSVWHPRQSTSALADLADTALQAGIDFLMREALKSGDLICSENRANAANGGLAIFALGKHGGRELNYSSDIDIVAFYDVPDEFLVDPLEANKFYSRLVRKLVALLDDRTEDGYVFRTDLRLRPDPGSTPVALSTDAALTYYEARGQNWERAAWIKGRVCAGDRKTGERFLKDLAPFVWRKHLDFATIADIQAMKRQINIARKVGEARVEGHNVKLGRGGIREIEFFTQTQQLIAGGRDPSLRIRPTEEAMAALAEAGWVSESTAEQLTEAYWFLREVENRLQMLRDEQTHTMPETAEGVAVIAHLMSFPEPDDFRRRYREILSLVTNYYGELFVEGATLASDLGDLVFTGSDDDPGTLETLSGLGFADPSAASATIRKWHYGGYPATRSSTARAHLTELLPDLLTIVAATKNADEALARFDHFLSRFPAGVQLFSLLRTHPQLCRMLIAFMASAPRLADAVIHRAHVVDALIDPAFADGVTRTDILIEKVDEFLGEARGFEDLIDRARIIGQEQKFLISAGFVSGTLDAARAGAQYTTLAETLMRRIFEAVCAEFAKRHGVVSGADVALLAFGKLASREMTLLSDLDFILLYSTPGASVEAESDGEKPLSAPQYFARLTQRLVTALSAPTSEGVLYETDMRLRPSGNAGPLATNLTAFTTYQMDSAWTWEHLALTRARVIVGTQDFESRVSTAIGRALSQPRTRSKIIDDVLSMRQRLATERKPRHRFDLKLRPGGLIDIEFIAQSAQLLDRALLDRPQAGIAETLSRMQETGLLLEAGRLLEAHGFYATILQAMSICLNNPFSDDGWTNAFKELLCQLTNIPDFERLEAALDEFESEVSAIGEAWYAQARSERS